MTRRLLVLAVIVACQTGAERDTRQFFEASSDVLFQGGCLSWYDKDGLYLTTCNSTCYVYFGKFMPAGSDLRDGDLPAPPLKQGAK